MNVHEDCFLGPSRLDKGFFGLRKGALVLQEESVLEVDIGKLLFHGLDEKRIGYQAHVSQTRG